jgi:signal transduction histidine kinase
MDDQLNPAEKPGAPEFAWIAERRALSREMHDDIAHSILIMMGNLEQVELYQDTWGPAALRSFSVARETAVATVEKVRALAARLRDQEDGGHQDPAPRAGTGDLPVELCYVLREAIADALTHSQAQQVVVDVRQSPDRITAVVEADGAAGPNRSGWLRMSGPDFCRCTSGPHSSAGGCKSTPSSTGEPE